MTKSSHAQFCMSAHTKALNNSINFFSEESFNSIDLSNSREICEQEERPFQSNLDNPCFHFVFLFISTWFFLNLAFSQFLFFTPLLPLPRHVLLHETHRKSSASQHNVNSNTGRQRATNTRGSLSLRSVQLAACFSPCVTYAFVEIFDHRDRYLNVPDNSELVKECHCCTVPVWCVSLLLFRSFLSLIIRLNLNERNASH